MADQADPAQPTTPWNKGNLIGQSPPPRHQQPDRRVHLLVEGRGQQGTQVYPLTGQALAHLRQQAYLPFPAQPLPPRLWPARRASTASVISASRLVEGVIMG
jgi:hypothetical protein